MLCSKSRLTSKRYSTLYSTPSLTEVKHTRSSYSGRDDRQAFGSLIVYSKIAENETGRKNISALTIKKIYKKPPILRRIMR